MSMSMLSRLFSNPIANATIGMVLASAFVGGLSLATGLYSGSEFRDGILLESHGMVLDILVIGLFLLALNKLGQRYQYAKRYQEEIIDFRFWESDEASYRIAGNVRRLNRLGVSRIDLTSSYLSKAKLSDTKLKRAILLSANLRKADLDTADLQRANLQLAKLEEAWLQNANLQGANLGGAHLQGAMLKGACMTDAINLTAEQLSTTFTLEDADLDPELQTEIEKRFPHLLESPWGF